MAAPQAIRRHASELRQNCTRGDACWCWSFEESGALNMVYGICYGVDDNVWYMVWVHGRWEVSQSRGLMQTPSSRALTARKDPPI